MGHVVRSISVADYLRGAERLRVAIAVARSHLALERVARAGHATIALESDGSSDAESRGLLKALAACGARALVLDLRNDLGREAVDLVRRSGVRVAVIDDPSERRLAADLAFFPPIPQVSEWRWDGFSGRLFIGWEWVILRPQFEGLKRAQRVRRIPSVLVTMGGSDPSGMTGAVLGELSRVGGEWELSVVLGPGYSAPDHIDEVVHGLGSRGRVIRDVTDMASLMAEADLAICSFGMTAYELAAAGVPAVYLCLSPDHARSASALVDRGAGVNLGLAAKLVPGDLAKIAQRLLESPAVRSQMSDAGQRLLDGKGARRVAGAVAADLRGASRG